jgi:uncharacterized membrane-anchored protein
VDLGRDVARVALPEGYRFADAADTRLMLEAMGNSVDQSEVGMIVPSAEDQDWFMVFEYRREGFVKDDDKDKIDKNAILESYKQGTEEANKRRKQQGIPGLHIVGWFEEPYYDQASHNLVWALRAKSDDGSEVVNYNVRLLGREGFMSVTLVDEPAKLARSKPEVDKLLAGFEYKKGKSYAEWVPGDKVAEYGLTALVAGGAAAAAAKLGLFAVLAKLFAKAGKAIVALLAVLALGAKQIFARLSGRSQR